MRYLVYLLAGLAVALALFVVVQLVADLSAEAAPDDFDAEIVVRNDIAGGFVRQYGEDLWFNVRLRPDPLIQSDAEASEWSVEIWSGTNCDGHLISAMAGSDTEAYGPRVYGRDRGVTLDNVGSVLLVHDGVLGFHGHAEHPGRHELDCQGVV